MHSEDAGCVYRRTRAELRSESFHVAHSGDARGGAINDSAWTPIAFEETYPALGEIPARAGLWAVRVAREGAVPLVSQIQSLGGGWVRRQSGLPLNLIGGEAVRMKAVATDASQIPSLPNDPPPFHPMRPVELPYDLPVTAKEVRAMIRSQEVIDARVEYNQAFEFEGGYASERRREDESWEAWRARLAQENAAANAVAEVNRQTAVAHATDVAKKLARLIDKHSSVLTPDELPPGD